MVLLDAPELSQALGVHDLEDPGVLVLPLDVCGVALVGVVQQLLQEAPQQATVAGGGGLADQLLRRGGPGGAGGLVEGLIIILYVLLVERSRVLLFVFNLDNLNQGCIKFLITELGSFSVEVREDTHKKSVFFL